MLERERARERDTQRERESSKVERGRQNVSERELWLRTIRVRLQNHSDENTLRSTAWRTACHTLAS